MLPGLCRMKKGREEIRGEEREPDEGSGTRTCPEERTTGVRRDSSAWLNGSADESKTKTTGDTDRRIHTDPLCAFQ